MTHDPLCPNDSLEPSECRVCVLLAHARADELKKVYRAPQQALTSEQILNEAKRLMATDRGAKYGDFRENHEHIASLWSAYLRSDISAEQASIMMLLVKVARTRTSPEVYDHYVDGAAYLAGAGRIATEKAAGI